MATLNLAPSAVPERPAALNVADIASALPVVIGLGFVQLVGTHFAAHGQSDRAGPDATALLLLVLGPTALIFRNRYPVAVLWLVTAVTLAYLLLDYAYGPIFLSMIVALYAAVQRGHRWPAAGAAVTLYAGCFGARYLLGLESPPNVGQLIFVGAWLLAVLASSEVARMRRLSSLEAERVREEEVQRRRSEERLRIARELHDVLAHNISLINVQAGVALHLMDKQPEQAWTALNAIEGASRDALAELRSVLDILHQPEEAAPRTPTAGLARLPGLTAQAEAAGLDVRTQVEGAPLPLTASVDAAAFRVIQESLTNVIRHAGASSATVRLCYRPQDLAIEIEDDGRGVGQPATPGGGSGLSGMRERVTALGGSFEAGPLPEHGFRVRAELPLQTAP